MPGKGYSTIGLKPAVHKRLQDITDDFYPGMFLPSTLIMLMNEVKMKRYSVETRNIRVNTSGKYYTITIRADVQDWLKGEHARLKSEYKAQYQVRCFTNFVSYFLINLFNSKIESQNHVIRIKESDFVWLHQEYDVYKENNRDEQITFEQFADARINNILEKLRTARELLAM